jgi:nucleoside-diphosphate-sugar epimerase
MKVFLTGGTGFIGRPLTKSLLERGWSVTVLVRNPHTSPAQALSKMGASLATGDVTNRESIRTAMNGADVVIHNAGHYEFGIRAAAKPRMQAVNVQGTENVLGLALKLGVQRSIYVSTAWAFGDSGPQLRDETFERSAPYRTVYEKSKTDAHNIARRYQQDGLPLVIACPNGVIGPNDHSVWGYFLRLYINKLLPPIAWSPNSIYSFVEVNDLVNGITLASEKARTGETYLLCGESTRIREIFEFWAEKPGAFKFRLWMPPRLATLMFWTMEPLQRAVGLPAFLSRETVSVGASNLNYSSEKAKRELGWSHQTAREMWFNTIDRELEILSKRPKGNLIARLKPWESEV